MDYWVDTNREFHAARKLYLPLTHMTKKWETLVLILKEGFKPSYCTEYITNDKDTKTACFPMISLSNISIDDAMQYQKSYGTLGIALDKKWGEKNDFNPVLYLERKSDLTNEIIAVFDQIKTSSLEELFDQLNGVETTTKSILTKNIIKIFAHSKNYDGKLVRNQTLYDEKYPFGLEREWRKIVRETDVPYFLAGEDFNRKSEFNKVISDIRIDFDLADLKSVIVESLYEKDAVVDILTAKYNLKEIPDDVKIIINGTRHVPDEG